MVRVNEYKAVGAGRLWRVAFLTAAAAIGTTARAEAALYDWSDSDTGYFRPGPITQPRRQKPSRHQAKKIVPPGKESAKPQGPVIIAISIEKQHLKIYDDNGFFAETPISTGMRGHPTPMGVFSVIQKQKLHHSNIYSGAPMPYMQRITWSGIAIHAGVLPGYPASHGCIRMPMAFAMKMWNWTKMGARVVVTPGEMTPAAFSHPLLVTQKVVPQPAVADELKVEVPVGVKSDKGADAGAVTPARSEANLELRSTVGHAATPGSLRERTHTADASAAMPAASASVTMSDAMSARAPAAGPSDANSAGAQPSETTTGEAKPAETDKASSEALAQAAGDTVKETSVSATESVKVEAKTAETGSEAMPEAAKADASRTETPKAAEKPAEPAKAADAPAVAPDPKKDTARLPGLAKPELPKRSGQISVLISRKDSKLYVRQEFKPLFDVPVTIAPSDRPLGTHVFTAEADKSDANVLRWSVVSLPARNAARNDVDDRPSRRRKMAGAPAETKPVPVPDSPAEALDRITIPPDAMARVAEALTTGASIIVSDQGINQGETGEGTDFIVSLR